MIWSVPGYLIFHSPGRIELFSASTPTGIGYTRCHLELSRTIHEFYFHFQIFSESEETKWTKWIFRVGSKKEIELDPCFLGQRLVFSIPPHRASQTFAFVSSNLLGHLVEWYSPNIHWSLENCGPTVFIFNCPTLWCSFPSIKPSQPHIPPIPFHLMMRIRTQRL